METSQSPSEEVLNRSPNPSFSQYPSLAKKDENKKYFQPIHTIPGEAAPFVLPVGASSCPIKSCPGYMRPCNPHWRLNEHMKLRHGWPRKHTQPNTDRRLAGKQRSQAYRKTNVAPMRNGKYKSKYVFYGDENDECEIVDGDSDQLDPFPELEIKTESQPPQKRQRKESNLQRKSDPKPDPPSARKSTRKRISTQKAIPQDIDFSSPPPPAETKSRVKRCSPSNQSKDEVVIEDAIEPRRSPAALIPKADLDQTMIAEIRDYIDELRLSCANMVEDPTTLIKINPESMARDLQELLDKNPPMVNTCMSTVQSQSITALYKALAIRRNSKASIYKMPSDSPYDLIGHKTIRSDSCQTEFPAGSKSIKGKSKKSRAPSKLQQQIHGPPQRTRVGFGKGGTPTGSSSSRRSTPAKLVLKFGNGNGNGNRHGISH